MNNSQNTHRHLLLSKNQSGRVEFCEPCDMIELTIGHVSVRVNAQDLLLLNELIQVAQIKLSYHQAGMVDLDCELQMTEIH